MTTQRPNIPLLGFAAYSGTGKTTLLEALLPKLTQLNLRIGVLKHAHHDFDIDKPGKDSYRLRKAGASQMLIASRNRHAMMTETPDAETDFEQLLTQFDCTKLDLILVEGCKNIAFPKIELHRAELNKPWLYPHDDNIIAVAADEVISTSLPQLNINDLHAIADFIVNYTHSFNIQTSNSVQAHMVKKSNTIEPSCCDQLSPALLSVEQGQEKILASIAPLAQEESIELQSAYCRVLSQPVTSSINVPQYTNSAMDGYAIRSDDIGRSSYHVVAEILAGYAYPHSLQKGEAVKIMTGAPVPAMADTVIMREQAVAEHDKVSFPNTQIIAGQNVRLAGEDLRQGSPVFSAGQRILSPEQGMLASLGLATCSVYRKVTVAIFSTGDEVQCPSLPPSDNSIYDSNRFTLMGLLTQLGCHILDFGIIEDNEALMIKTIDHAVKSADIVITSGGVSVGDADFIKSALEKMGHINFWRINMRPGRPLAYGKIKETPFFGLPGNPVAAMVSFINFVEPAIRKMQGEVNWQPLKVNAIASEPLRSRIGRTEFSRGIYLINSNGQLEVKTTGKQGSGILCSMSIANCLIEIAPAIDTVNIGESVTIIPLQGRI